MHLHQVQNKPLKAWQGLCAVVGMLAALIVANLLTGLLGYFAGALAAEIAFWAIGILIALWAMRRFVLKFTYGMSSSQLRIAYAYGRYERVMTDIYFNNVRAAGTLEEMKKRYPDARVNRATRPGCDIAPFAVACLDNGKIAIYVLQPDDAIRTRLVEAVKNNRK